MIGPNPANTLTMPKQARPRQRSQAHLTPGPGRRRSTASENSSPTELPRAARSSLARELRRQIRHLNRCIRLLRYVDLRVYEAGRAIFASDAGLTLWLCDPAPSLKGMVPLVCMRTAKGRREVGNLLTALAHGVSV